MYTIGEMAKILGVATSTLRYYDKEGLLPFTKRTEGGMRIFTDDDYEILLTISCLKNSGLELKEIKEFIRLIEEGDDSIDSIKKRLEIVRNRREEVKKQIADMEKTIHMLDYKCWYFETALKAGTTEVPDNLPDDELPEDIRAVRQRISRYDPLNK